MGNLKEAEKRLQESALPDPNDPGLKQAYKVLNQADRTRKLCSSRRGTEPGPPERAPTADPNRSGSDAVSCGLPRSTPVQRMELKQIHCPSRSSTTAVSSTSSKEKPWPALFERSGFSPST